MKLLMLSGQRRAEVAEMRWSEVDLEKRLWTLPSQRAKNGRQHTVPITDAMFDVLRRCRPFFIQISFSRQGATHQFPGSDA